MATVEFSFFRFERAFVCCLVFWLFYSYAPGPVLRPQPDAHGVLARFQDSTSIGGIERPFFFGLATAAAHVEDELNDGWLDFARQGKVAAFANQQQPEVRNKFWTQPEVEIDLAASTGVTLFRLGVDWGRVVPTAPADGAVSVPDEAALARYREIIQLVRARNMKVMLTLFHHSAPKWMAAYGGLVNPVSVEHFAQFADLVVEFLGDLVDYWVPFNEPTVFVGLTYCAGAWPPGFPEPGPLTSGFCMMAPAGLGNYSRAMAHVALAHRAAAKSIRRKYNAPIGAAHNIAYMSPAGALDVAPSLLSDRLMTYPFLDSLRGAMDFVGLNYYGQEFMSGVGKIRIMPEEEYSDSGRAVFPDGMYHLLKTFHKRFPLLPIIITENGVADDADIIRPAYLAEHLVAVAAARAEGVPVAGFVFWTISDNWEWADGYCPKFGLAAVDRSRSDLKRTIRETSFNLFKEVATKRQLTQGQADAAWGVYTQAVRAKANRSFCRALEGTSGLTGFSGIDNPVHRSLVSKDWRLGMWRPPPYSDQLSAVGRRVRDAVLGTVFGALGYDLDQVADGWHDLKLKARQHAEQRAKQKADAKATGMRGKPAAKQQPPGGAFEMGDGEL